MLQYFPRFGPDRQTESILIKTLLEPKQPPSYKYFAYQTIHVEAAFKLSNKIFIYLFWRKYIEKQGDLKR